MPTGKLVRFNPLRQYGFIEAEPDDVFVNLAALHHSGIFNPKIGDMFSYRIATRSDGRLQAADVDRITPADAG